MLKRSLDLAIALAISPLAAFVTVVAALAICIESPGSALFWQRRVGRNGEIFVCYKLRTMYLNTPQAASHEVTRNAVTGVGSILRRSKIDELPQIWNVIRGDMSFVGPRPCLPTQAILIDRRKSLGVFKARPGLTGLAQVNDIDMSNPEHLAQVDATYVESATTLGDLRLILLTFLGKGTGDRVGT